VNKNPVALAVQFFCLMLMVCVYSCSNDSVPDMGEAEAVDRILEYADPEATGFAKDFTGKLSDILQKGVQDSVAPAIVCVVGRSGKIVFNKAFGSMTYDATSIGAGINTIFDLASVTKVTVTATLSMIFYDRGLLKLDEPVSAYIPEVKNGSTFTIRNLLTHTAGLVAWDKFYLDHSGKEDMLKAVFSREQEYEPGSKTVYSDLGIIMLATILERISGKPLDVLARDEIFGPLGMKDTMYNPPPELLGRIAPTEDDPWRGRVVHGEVHDENTYALGGVSGHAGLFSTAPDLAVFCQMLLNKGVYAGKKTIEPATIGYFTRRQDIVKGSSRALGWDTPSGSNSAGTRLSGQSFGHTGFTGTMLWIDPERDLFIILLTNRVYPTRENQKINGFRRLVNDTVIEMLQ